MCLKSNKMIQLTEKENSPSCKQAATARLRTKKRPPLSEISSHFHPPEKRTRMSTDPVRQVLHKQARVPSAPPPQKKRALRRTACGKCVACLRLECGRCARCLKKSHFGGEGRCKDICFQRRCHFLYPQQKAKDEQMLDDATKLGDNKMKKNGKSISSSKQRTTTNKKKKQQRRKSCGECVACLRQDCGECNKCLENLQFVGDDEICLFRHCHKIYPQQKKIDTNLRTTMLFGEFSSENFKNHFTLSKYLSKTTVPARVEKLYASTIYGIPVPKTSKAASDREHKHAEESKKPRDPSVNLCDCVGCCRESHPDSEPYCEDCSPKGFTCALMKYLIQSDKDKQKFMKEAQGSSYQDYIQHLFEIEALEDYSKGCIGFPISELYFANHDTQNINQDSYGRSYSPLMDTFLGKPVRLFVPSIDAYHTGRIIDYRRLLMKEPFCTDLAAELNTTEFLIQFSAGKEGRKVSYHHWIMIEEHALAIGMKLVWELSADEAQVPAMIWLPSTRELVTTQMKFYKTEESCGGTDDLIAMFRDDKFVSEYAIVRRFGVSEQFRLTNVKNKCIPFRYGSNDDTKMDHVNSPMIALQVLMAMTEIEEQKRVREWRRWVQNGSQMNGIESYVPSILHPIHQDDQDRAFPPFHVSPFPNVVRGLDRLKIVTELEQRTKKTFTRSVLTSITGTILVPAMSNFLATKTMIDIE